MLGVVAVVAVAAVVVAVVVAVVAAVVAAVVVVVVVLVVANGKSGSSPPTGERRHNRAAPGSRRRTVPHAATTGSKGARNNNLLEQGTKEIEIAIGLHLPNRIVVLVQKKGRPHPSQEQLCVILQPKWPRWWWCVVCGGGGGTDSVLMTCVYPYDIAAHALHSGGSHLGRFSRRPATSRALDNSQLCP